MQLSWKYEHINARASWYQGNSTRTKKLVKGTLSASVRDHMLIYDHWVASEDSTILGSTSNKFILELKACLLKGINQPLRGTSSFRNSYYYRLPFWLIFATFVYYYCPLVLHFSSRKSINKIENLRKSINVSPKWLFFRLWNSLKKTNKCTMEVKRLRLLALEIFKLSTKTVQLLLRTI